MNWKRIWIGALLAGFAYFLIGGVIHHVLLAGAWQTLQQSGKMLSPKPSVVIVLALQDLLIGFVLTWLYVLARPRLGPGPKTAIVMGSIAWVLLAVPTFVFQWLWMPWPAQIAWVELGGNLVRCWISIYLAGWQYIEKAP